MFPFLPVRLIGSIRYETVKKLPRIHVPVMIMHSRNDDLIRFTHAQRNLAAANEPKMFWEIYGSHNSTLEADPVRYVEGLETFLKGHFK